MKAFAARQNGSVDDGPVMLNYSSPYHAQGPQRRERLLNLATLRKPIAAVDAKDPSPQTPPGEVKSAPAEASEAICPE